MMREKISKRCKKFLDVYQKVVFLGQFYESKKSVGKNRFFSIFRKIDLINFFDSIASPTLKFLLLKRLLCAILELSGSVLSFCVVKGTSRNSNGIYKGVIKREAVYKCTNKDYLPKAKPRANDHFTCEANALPTSVASV